MGIKHMHRVEQPREKLIKYGAAKLKNEELLAIILGTGTRGIPVVEFSKNIFHKFNGTKIAQAEISELRNIKGLGQSRACGIVACFELGRRLLQDKQTALILSPREVWEDLKDIRTSKKEHFVVFYLNTQNQVTEKEIISVGTLNASLIHPREVFEPAVRHVAASILIAHNHPSGSLEPSGEDVAVTERLVEVGRVLGIDILDHIIVTAKSYMSFKEKKLL